MLPSWDMNEHCGVQSLWCGNVWQHLYPGWVLPCPASGSVAWQASHLAITMVGQDQCNISSPNCQLPLITCVWIKDSISNFSQTFLAIFFWPPE